MQDDEVDVLTGKLYKEFERLNRERFEGEIKPYKLRFSRYSARTHGRITYCRGEIMISLNMYEQHGWDAVTQTLLHEMTHALLHQRGSQNRHSKIFWREFEARGGVRQRLDVKPRAAYVYACPTCGVEIERMRKIKRPWMHSCIRCDKNYNPRHRLYLKRDKHQNSIKETKTTE